MPVTLIGTRAAPSKPRLLHAATSWPRHALTPPRPHPAALPSLRRGRLRALPLRAQIPARRRRQGPHRAERRRDRGGGRRAEGGQGELHRVDPPGAARLEDRQLRAGDGLPHRHHYLHHYHCHRHRHSHHHHHHHRRRRRLLLLTSTTTAAVSSSPPPPPPSAGLHAPRRVGQESRRDAQLWRDCPHVARRVRAARHALAPLRSPLG